MQNFFIFFNFFLDKGFVIYYIKSTPKTPSAKKPNAFIVQGNGCPGLRQAWAPSFKKETFTMKNSVSKQILRFKSVPAPLLQWLNSPTHYCAIMQQLNMGYTDRLPNLYTLQGTDRAAAFAALVCIANGCRISELLKLTNKSLLPSGLGFVPGSKGSNARQIFTFIAPQVVAELAAAPEEFFLFNITYNTIYRVCKQVGLTLNIPGHANQAVTHQGRYLNASQATKVLGAAAASGVLGHRGRQTLQGYANPIETKAAVKRRKRQKMASIAQQKEQKRQAWYELCDKIANGEVEGPVYEF